MSSGPQQTAMEKALAIPELLTPILLQVDMQTLLVSCLRVSRFWSQVINHSCEIQQLLFFLPAHSMQETETPVFNPLLRRHFGDVFGLGRNATLRCVNCFFMMDWAPVKRAHVQGTPWEIGDWESTDHHDRFIRAGASWRRMLVSQPPPPRLVLAEYRGKSTFQAFQVGTVLPSPSWPGHGRNTGLVMGQVYDVVLECFERDEDKFFFKVGWYPSEQVLAAVLSPVSAYGEAPDGCLENNVICRLFRSEDHRPCDLPEVVVRTSMGWVFSKLDYYFDSMRNRDLEGLTWKCRHFSCAREAIPEDEESTGFDDWSEFCETDRRVKW